MIIPQNGQTILSFSAIRFLDGITPISQIDRILSDITDVSHRMISSEIKITPGSNSQLLSDFGSHMLPSTVYIAHDGTTKGYSQPKLMGYLTATHASNIDASDISAIAPQIESYVDSLDIAVYNSNKIWTSLYPHSQLISGYNKLTLSDISKILTTVTLEDISPSGISMVNLLYSYEMLYGMSGTILNSNAFNDGTKDVSLTSFAYNNILNSTPAFTNVMLDISNFISSDSIFYDNMMNRILTVTGTNHSSPEFKTDLKNVIRDSIYSYFVLGDVASSYIGFISSNLDSIIVDIVTKYSELMQSNTSRVILESLVSSGVIDQINPDEKLMIQAIYSKYIELYSDKTTHIESTCSRISETSLDLLNTHIHLYSGLFRSMQVEISDVFSQSIVPPSRGIPSVNTEISIASDISTSVSNISFSTADPNNLKIMNAAISFAFTNNFEAYIKSQHNQSSFSAAVLQPIFDASLSKANVSSEMSAAKLTESIMDAITAEFNASYWTRTNEILKTYHPTLMTSMDLPNATVFPDILSMLKDISKQYSKADSTSAIISQAISISIFNVAMNANLDSFSI